jgi:hypothetical protein
VIYLFWAQLSIEEERHVCPAPGARPHTSRGSTGRCVPPSHLSIACQPASLCALLGRVCGQPIGHHQGGGVGSPLKIAGSCR